MTDTPELPPLPEPDGWICDGHPDGLQFKPHPISGADALTRSTAPVFRAGTVQRLMRAYAAGAVRVALARHAEPQIDGWPLYSCLPPPAQPQPSAEPFGYVITNNVPELSQYRHQFYRPDQISTAYKDNALSCVPVYLGPAAAEPAPAEAAQPVQGWRPIETAPKDGAGFLGYIPSKRSHVARQDLCPMHWSGWGGGTWESSTSGHRIHDDVTHWMPLPAAPKDHT